MYKTNITAYMKRLLIDWFVFESRKTSKLTSLGFKPRLENFFKVFFAFDLAAWQLFPILNVTCLCLPQEVSTPN